MAIFSAHSIITISSYQGLSNTHTVEYRMALADSYTQEMRKVLAKEGKWKMGQKEMVFQPGSVTLALAFKALREYYQAIELNPSNARSHLLLAWHYGVLNDLMSSSTVPVTSLNPDKSDKRDKLTRPTKPVTANKPAIPKRSDQLNNPTKANITDQADKKDHPGKPGNPEHPDKEGTPDKPDKPDKPFIRAAQEEFQLAIELDPKSSYVHQVFGTWAFNQAKKDRSWLKLAVREYREAVELDPSLTAEALTHYLSFVWHFDRLKDILPDTPDRIFTIASFLYDNGFWELNEPSFIGKMKQLKEGYKQRNQIGNKSENLYAYYKTLASIYKNKGESYKAMAALQDYLELEPENAEAHFWLADYSFYRGSDYGYSWAFSKSHHQKAIELSPDNAFFRKWYGRHLYYRKDFKEAAYQLRKALELSPRDNEISIWLEECYQRTKEYGLIDSHN